MRKFRLNKWGQLVQLSEDEIDQALSKGDRWTVRAEFVIAAVLLCGVALIFDFFQRH